MLLFNIGELVIDTKSNNAVRVVAIIPQGNTSMFDIYVLMDEDTGNIYMRDDTDLVMYTKYYWDDSEKDGNR